MFPVVSVAALPAALAGAAAAAEDGTAPVKENIWTVPLSELQATNDAVGLQEYIKIRDRFTYNYVGQEIDSNT